LIEIGSKTAEKNSAQTDRQTNKHYENNGHLAVNQKFSEPFNYNQLSQVKFGRRLLIQLQAS